MALYDTPRPFCAGKHEWYTGKAKKSGILIAYECKQIRSLIFEGHSSREIMELLNLKPRTFYRYLEKIRKEDYFDLMTDRKGNLAVAVNLTRDRLSRILDRLKTIANNGTQIIQWAVPHTK